MSDSDLPRAQGHPLGVTRAGLAFRLLIALAVILIVAAGVFAYTAITRIQLDPNRQAAWAGRTATAVAGGPQGTPYVAFLREIYEINTRAGTVTLVAGRATDPGSGQPGATADGDAALGAAIRPTALAIGPGGQIYFADQLTGTVRTIQGGDLKSIGRAQQVGGIAVNPATGTVYFADQGNDQVFAINSVSGGVAAVAGNGQSGFAGDGGPALAAELSHPEGLAVSRDRLLIADSGNDRVRQVDLRTDVITTVAGSGKRGLAGDGGTAARAQLDDPTAVAANPEGGFVIADEGNRELRQVSARGVISTLAGTGQPGTDNPESSVERDRRAPEAAGRPRLLGPGPLLRRRFPAAPRLRRPGRLLHATRRPQLRGSGGPRSWRGCRAAGW